MIEGHDELSDLTDGEKKMLAKNPGCRLACQVSLVCAATVASVASAVSARENTLSLAAPTPTLPLT